MPRRLTRYKAVKHGKETYVFAKTPEEAKSRINTFKDWEDITLDQIQVAPDEE